MLINLFNDYIIYLKIIIFFKMGANSCCDKKPKRVGRN